MPLMKVWSKTEKTYITKHVNLDPRIVTAFLQKNDEETSVFCMYCGKKLMKAKFRIAQVAPGLPPEEINHLNILCSNPSCKTFWYFVGVS